MTDTYTLTVKFAPQGTSHYNRKMNKWEISDYGHVWLEARKPGESMNGQPSFSGGWSPGNDWLSVKDNFSPYDWADYQGKNISLITVAISEAQFNRLQNYPTLAAAGKISGFSLAYNAADNSCIDFSGKGLGYIGLADKNFDGSGLFWARPDKQVNAFLEQIAKNRPQGADLVVEHRGRTYVFGENERGVEKFWKTVDPYWYLGENQRQELNPEQMQYARNHAPSADTAVFNLNSMPKPFQNLYPKIQAHLNTYHEKYGIPIDEEKKHNAAVALSVLAYSETMGKRQDVPLLFNIKDGQYLIGERNPGLIKATMDMERAASLPAEQSLSRVQDITQQFEQQELERQMARQQSRGMSMG